MKKLILLLVLPIVFACHKKKDDPVPVAKTAELRVYYHAFDNYQNTQYWLYYDNNSNPIKGTLSQPEYTTIKQQASGTTIQGGMKSTDGSGFKQQIFVIYNNDTIYKGESGLGSAGFNITLPKL